MLKRKKGEKMPKRIRERRSDVEKGEHAFFKRHIWTNVRVQGADYIMVPVLEHFKCLLKQLSCNFKQN